MVLLSLIGSPCDGVVTMRWCCNKLISYFKLSLLVLIVSLTTACSDETDTDPSASPLTDTLILRDTFNQEADTYTQGENIEFYLIVTNNTDSAITLNFSNGQQFDFYIEESGVEIWRWSDNLSFTSTLSSRTIPAQSSIIVNEIWDQSLIGGSNIPIGSFTAFGSLLNHSPTVKYNFSIQ